MKEEVNSLLHGAKNSATEESVGDKAEAGGLEDVGATIVEEMAKVQQKLEQQHEDVRRWLGANNQRISQSIDADDGVMGTLDSLKAMLMAVRREGIDTPRQACVLPPWKFAKAHGLSEDEQKPDVWINRLKEWREDDFKEGKGFFKKKKRLFLVCAQTHRLVPCGRNGQGYDIQQPRTWLRISVSVATFALQVVCSTLAAMAALPVAGAGAAVEAAVETSASAAMDSFQSMLESLNLDDNDTDLDVGPQVLNKLVPFGDMQSIRGSAVREDSIYFGNNVVRFCIHDCHLSSRTPAACPIHQGGTAGTRRIRCSAGVYSWRRGHCSPGHCQGWKRPSCQP